MADRKQMADPRNETLEGEVIDTRAPWRKDADRPMELMPIGSGQVAQTGHTEFITAQKVAVSRQTRMTQIKNECKREAAAAGELFYYSIPFKDKRRNRTVYVEGPSIKLANTLARIWGNCLVRCRVEETPSSWIFYGQFVDLETGFTLERPFQQRKSQTSGMNDADRQLDIIFAIGVSKATRNAVVNALSDLANEMMEEAKNDLLNRINSKPDVARQWLADNLKNLEIDISRVERVYARKLDKFTVRDLAKLTTEIGAVRDGFAMAEEMWPSADDEEAEALANANAEHRANDEKREAKGNAKKAGGSGRAKKAEQVAGDPGDQEPDVSTSRDDQPPDDDGVQEQGVQQPQEASASETAHEAEQQPDNVDGGPEAPPDEPEERPRDSGRRGDDGSESEADDESLDFKFED